MPLELERPKLSAEEERLPYAKYFHKPLAPIPQEKLDIWNGPAADPAAALPFAARGRFQDADVPGLDNGFCVAPDGTGFVANTTFMPGVRSTISASSTLADTLSLAVDAILNSN